LLADADKTTKEAMLKGFDEKSQKLLSEPLDPRSDLYSVGASIYHILTGTVPPDAATRAKALHEGKPDPLRPPSEIDENIPVDISNAFMKSMSLLREDRFDSAVIMNQVMRTAVVRTQERTPDGAEKPIELKKLARTAAAKSAPVPEAPVFKQPVIEEVPESLKPATPVGEVASVPKETPKKKEEPSVDSLLELEKKKTEELEAERIRLENEQKRIEARRIELEAERERLEAEKLRLESEAKLERERQEKERLEQEAEEERKRAAKKMAELEAERQKRQAEEKRLEKLAEEEKRKAEERLKALRSEHERIREERRRIEEAEKEELERTEQRLLELSVQPNRDSGVIPGHDDEPLLEVHASDPAVKTTQEIIDLLEDEPLAMDRAKGKSASNGAAYDADDDFSIHQESKSGFPIPMIAAAVVLILLVAVGGWMFMSSGGSAPEPTAVAPPPAPVEQPILEPEQNALTDPSGLAVSNTTDANSAVIDPAAANTDPRSAFNDEQERRARQAKLDAAKKATATPAKTPKKVTVDDLINDN
jgi:hypothetical protein